MTCNKPFLILGLLGAAAISRATSAGKPDAAPPIDITNQCRLWLAPSTTATENEPKLGLFAGVDYLPNATVGRPEVAIPLVDFVESWNRKTEVADNVLAFLEGFLWTAEYAGAKWEGNHSVTLTIPGLGVLANFHSGTSNVDWKQSAVLLREDSVFEAGKAHPSRGAITTFSNITMVATQNIKAGMELFANFGDIWDGNYTDDMFQDKITRWDYREADKVLDAILSFMSKYDSEMMPELKDEVLDFIMGKVLGTAAGAHSKVIRSLIPAHPGKLQTVKDMGGTFAYRNADLVKSKKWLEKHGTCMDNLEYKPSTNPLAGRGAFATRRLKKGTVIAPMPMLHISDKSVMARYELLAREGDNGNTYYEHDPTKPLGDQLVINYCFGHPESSMLLLPVSSMVSQINHSPEPNARITWAKSKHWGNDNEWHDATVERCSLEHRIGVVMEVFAVKDIKEGDEITIDYGPEWSAAWSEHMKSFDSTKNWLLKAEDLKKLYKDQQYKTVDELVTEPYPQGIGTACFVLSEPMTDGNPKVDVQGNERRIWNGPTDDKAITGLVFSRCDVIGSTQVNNDHFFNYTVSISSQEDSFEVVDVPHKAITFIDTPYASDTFSPNAFRHWIGIPDLIFPQAWRDLRA